LVSISRHPRYLHLYLDLHRLSFEEILIERSAQQSPPSIFYHHFSVASIFQFAAVFFSQLERIIGNSARIIFFKTMRDYRKFHFDGQKPDEQILLVLHRYWFDILSQFFLVFGMIFLLIGSFAFLPVLFPDLNNNNARNLFMFLENLFFILIWIMSFLIWIDYYFDIWIVTDRRIVNIEQKALFSRTISELELEKVQDISTDVHGVIPTFLNYGDLQVQTAGEQEKFLFHNIPDPYSVKDLIMNLQKKQERKEEHVFSEMIAKKVHHEDSV
jgi:hypothetical protein